MFYVKYSVLAVDFHIIDQGRIDLNHGENFNGIYWIVFNNLGRTIFWTPDAVFQTVLLLGLDLSFSTQNYTAKAKELYKQLRRELKCIHIKFHRNSSSGFGDIHEKR